MSAHDSIFRQLLFHIFADDASLNAGHHIVLIDPFDFVHAGHVNRDDGSFLLGGHHEGLGDVGASSEGNENYVELLGSFYKLFCLFMGGYVGYVVDYSLEFSCSQEIELLD